MRKRERVFLSEISRLIRETDSGTRIADPGYKTKDLDKIDYPTEGVSTEAWPEDEAEARALVPVMISAVAEEKAKHRGEIQQELAGDLVFQKYGLVEMEGDRYTFYTQGGKGETVTVTVATEPIEEANAMTKRQLFYKYLMEGAKRDTLSKTRGPRSNPKLDYTERKGKADLFEDSGEEEGHHYDIDSMSDDEHIDMIRRHLDALEKDKEYDEDHIKNENRRRLRVLSRLIEQDDSKVAGNARDELKKHFDRPWAAMLGAYPTDVLQDALRSWVKGKLG